MLHYILINSFFFFFDSSLDIYFLFATFRKYSAVISNFRIDWLARKAFLQPSLNPINDWWLQSCSCTLLFGVTLDNTSKAPHNTIYSRILLVTLLLAIQMFLMFLIGFSCYHYIPQLSTGCTVIDEPLAQYWLFPIFGWICLIWIQKSTTNLHQTKFRSFKFISLKHIKYE